MSSASIRNQCLIIGPVLLLLTFAFGAHAGPDTFSGFMCGLFGLVSGIGSIAAFVAAVGYHFGQE